jgi:predicted nuclease of restriction endonuclease-like (RecB) superfamily
MHMGTWALLRADVVTPEEEIKGPYFLEFLALKDECSETTLDSALITKLETFLLKLGGVERDVVILPMR